MPTESPPKCGSTGWRARAGPACPSAGSALARAGRLPGIGPDGLLQGIESPVVRAIAPVRAAVRGIAPRALDLLGSGSAWGLRQVDRLPPGLRALPAAVAARIARVPRKVQMAVAAGLAIPVAVTGGLATRGPAPID